MAAKYSIPELVEREKRCIEVPCVYDYASARAVELAGYRAMLLSGGEVGEILGGLSETEMCESELLFMASHICAASPLPMVVDCGCFTPDPPAVYRWSGKFVEAGAMALLIEDEEDVDREVFLKMVRAALKACEGSRCVVMARTNRPLETEEQIEYAVKLLNDAMDLGAYMSMACSQNNFEIAKTIGGRVKGLKMYPDQNSVNGVPEVVNEEIYPYGYAMISYHFTLKVAMANMIEYGKKNLAAGNNIPSNELRLPNGYTGASALSLFDYQKKYDQQAEYTGEHRIFKIPGENGRILSTDNMQ